MMFCTACHSEMKPKTEVPGSVLIEIVLWLSIILPGLIYSIWRLSNKKKICRTCGSTEIIPTNSPMAKKLKSS